MKLFVTDNNNVKLYLSQVAQTRQELAMKIGGTSFILQGLRYSVNDVQAESDKSDTAGGAIVGGLIGAFFTPAAFLVGGIIGGLIGNSSDNEEAKQIITFNGSQVEKIKL